MAGCQATVSGASRDAEVIREPDREEIRLDREVEAQLSARGPPALRKMYWTTTPCWPSGTELEALDLEAVQHRAVSEPIAVRVVDEFGALSKRSFLPRSRNR